MFSTVRKMLKDEAGATAIEYGLIAALIGAALVAGLPTLTDALDNLWVSIASNLTLN